MQYPMIGVCSVCKAVSYAWNMRLSRQYLMLWAVIKVVRKESEFPDPVQKFTEEYLFSASVFRISCECNIAWFC